MLRYAQLSYPQISIWLSECMCEQSEESGASILEALYFISVQLLYGALSSLKKISWWYRQGQTHLQVRHRAVHSDVGKTPKIMPEVKNPFQAYLMSASFIIYPVIRPRSFIRRTIPWYNCSNLKIFLRPVRLALSFEVGILISLSVGYDKILSLALIRMIHFH